MMPSTNIYARAPKAIMQDVTDLPEGGLVVHVVAAGVLAFVGDV